MAKIIQDIQFGEKTTLIYQCWCGEDSWLKIERSEWHSDVSYHIWIDIHPTSLRQRLVGAWKSLRGQEHFGSNYVMLSEEQISNLLKELETEVNATSNNK